MKILAVLSVLFVFVVIISALYWGLIHPILVKYIRYRLFALRDKARMKAIEDQLGATQGFQTIERFMSKTIWCMPHITLLSFLIFAKTCPKDSKEEKETMKEVWENTPIELLTLRDSAVKLAFILMVINSPLLVLMVSVFSTITVPLLFLLWASGRMTKYHLREQTEEFVEKLPNKKDLDSYGILCPTQ